MPKSAKTRPKPKLKAKSKTSSQQVSITSKKSYWITLTSLTVGVTVVYAYIIKIALAQIALLAVAVVLALGFVGYVRVTSSKFVTFWRAVFIFAGVSIIGFGIWAAMIYYSMQAGVLASAVKSLGDQFFGVTSLVICLAAGGFIGELISKNKTVQEHFVDRLKENRDS
jgi:hypothetical protein